MGYKRLDGTKDLRRKHPHYLVTVTYGDNETFGRVYTDLEKAQDFAARQKKSPIVKRARVKQLS
jgi:ssDNA-specific exonuclease RecJ